MHDHMTAFIAVFDHPFYAVTDDQGAFTIPNVPVGKYKMQAWHEVLGLLEKEVGLWLGKALWLILISYRTNDLVKSKL